MITNELKEKIEKENKVTFVSEIDYDDKKYIKTIKQVKNGIEYIYYELQADKIKEVSNEELIKYFKCNYETRNTSIIY